MGKGMASGREEARTVVAGTFAAPGQSAWKRFRGPFNVSIWGAFTGSVTLERTFDGGVTALPLSRDGAGAEATFTAPASLVVDEAESGVLYRLNCTSLTSGAANYRLSQ